jgi:hypothetical protein
VKYKKHKKAPAGSVGKNHAISVLHHPAALTKLQQQQLATVAHLATEKHKESPGNSLPPHLVNGLILKTALTNPSEVSDNITHTINSSFWVFPNCIELSFFSFF